MRRGYTLIEIIITVAMTGILSIGMFKAFEAITLRSEKAKILTTLSIDSQSTLDQISLLLYNRAPMSLKSCTNQNNCVSMDETTSGTILQWYGTASESYQTGAYSGFVDMSSPQTNRVAKTLYSPNTYQIAIEENQTAKWNRNFNIKELGLMFAGTFEDGIVSEPYELDSITDTIIQLHDTSTIDKIFEKYYLVDTAYAVTRQENDPCGVEYPNKHKDDLLLYYDFRPWKTPAQNMCDGNFSLLSKNVNGFGAHIVNGTIRLGIDMNRTVRGGNSVHLSKQKVVF